MADYEGKDVFELYTHHDSWSAESTQPHSMMRRPTVAQSSIDQYSREDELPDVDSEEGLETTRWGDLDVASPSSDGFQGFTPGTERDGYAQELEQLSEQLGYWAQGQQWQSLIHQAPYSQPQWQGQQFQQFQQFQGQPQQQWQQWPQQQWQPMMPQWNGQPMMPCPQPMIYGQMICPQPQWQHIAPVTVPQPMPTPTPKPVKQESRSPPQRLLRPAGELPVRTKGKGYRKNKLAEEQKIAASTMRKIGACWRCVFQKDPVSLLGYEGPTNKSVSYGARHTMV